MKDKFEKFLILLSPSRAFQKKNKARFLAVFDARHGASAALSSRFGFVLKITASVLGIFAVILGGVSVYADTANVSPSSVLYPWKRLAESVQLAVTPTGAKAELQATLAARRVTEIDDLEASNPTSTLISNLQSDANASVNASIVAATQAGLHDGELSGLCGKLLSTVATSSAVFQGDLQDHAGLIARFTDQCEAASGESEGPFNAPPFAGTSTASTTVTTTSTVSPQSFASSTISVHHRVPPFLEGSDQATSSGQGTNLEDRIKSYLNRYFKNSGDGSSNGDGDATTTISSPSDAAGTSTPSTGPSGSVFDRILNWWPRGSNNENGANGGTDGNNGQGNGHASILSSPTSTITAPSISGGDELHDSATSTVNFDSPVNHLLQSNGDN